MNGNVMKEYLQATYQWKIKCFLWIIQAYERNKSIAIDCSSGEYPDELGVAQTNRINSPPVIKRK